MYYNPDDTIWVMGKFAYGVSDDDIKDEDVDVWLDRGCDGAWELLDTVRTTDDGDHPTVEGVEDTGGWVFYDATSLDLGVGRHRFLLVVGGDLSTTEVYVDLVEPGTPIILSDADGTLTTAELAALADRGLVPAWAFGNTASDAEAYDNAGVLPLDQRIMFRFSDDSWGARRLEDYAELLPEIDAAPPVTCP
jgi:hypothetical protein